MLGSFLPPCGTLGRTEIGFLGQEPSGVRLNLSMFLELHFTLRDPKPWADWPSPA